MFKLGDLVKTYCPRDKEWHNRIGRIETIDHESNFPYKVRFPDEASRYLAAIGYKEKELINLNNKFKMTIRRKGGVSNETETS